MEDDMMDMMRANDTFNPDILVNRMDCVARLCIVNHEIGGSGLLIKAIETLLDSVSLAEPESNISHLTPVH